ncbi:PGA62 [Candida jiufengensis]|uniref:PGA62 n=1 Tax=Candida jiufengensis TaxID=497108 RepID=UPI0022252DEE|nr:PGA62 [Candida jiufengensis]KAI5955341.1 PGA62 [Candida jiufengensis]
MKGIFSLSVLISTTFALSEVATIRSTTISTYSSCSSTASNIPVLPKSSSVFYGNSSTSSIQAGSEQTTFYSSSSKKHQTSYEYETDYETDLSQVTYTTCDSNGHCYVTTDLEKLTTYTTTINGILTVVTTLVPVESTIESATPTSSAAANPGSVTYSSPIIATSTSTLTTIKGSIKVSPSAKESFSSTVVAPAKSASTKDSSPSSIAGPAKSVTLSANGIDSTVTDVKSTLLTITTCSQGSCSIAEKTTGYKVYSSDNTVYTTYCPLPSQESSSVAPVPLSSTNGAGSDHTEYSTKIITVTSCSENKCSEVSKETTGVKIISNINTVYTTYCPISEIPQSSSSASLELKPQETVKSSQPSAASIKSEPQETVKNTIAVESKVPVTINVITDNIVTQTPTIEQVSQETSQVQSSSNTVDSYSITTYEGGVALAGTFGAGGFMAALISFLLFI